MTEPNIDAVGSGTFEIGGDLPVYRLGFGAMRIVGAGVWGPPRDRDESIKVLRRAVELGVTFIDTAEAYGPMISEELIAEALHPYRDGVVIATKGGLDRPGPNKWDSDAKPERLREQVEGSLRRLKLEQIDLWQLHRIDSKVPEEEQFGAISNFVREGKIRHVGLSEVNVEEIERARKYFPVVSVQNRYNLADREWEGVLDYCEKENIGFIPWFPLQMGKLAKPGGAVAAVAEKKGATASQVALAWLLRRSPVMLPIPGTSSVKHLEENMGAASLQLTDEEFESISGG